MFIPVPMRLFLYAAAVLLSATGALHPALAQSNQFRTTRAHLGLGYSVYTYYGPVDLKSPDGPDNHISASDPAIVALGSFPIVGDRFYFRGMFGVSQFDTKNERALMAEQSLITGGTAENEFLTNEVFFFEPEIIYTIMPGSNSRFLPYIYTGFGALIADPFGQKETNINLPGSGVPGPERTVFTLPFGIGVDYAVTRRFSVYIDASYRFDLNYVGRNEVQGTNPHNTSLVMGGFRVGIFPVRRTVIEREPLPIPEPMRIPPYQPPPPPEMPPPERCVLVELNTVYFPNGGAELDAETRALLTANVEALRLNPACCVDIVGYTDEQEGNTTYALRLSRQRAEAVFRFYVDNGIAPERLRPRAGGIALPPCGKDEGPNCRRNRRVDSIPMDCDLLTPGPR